MSDLDCFTITELRALHEQVYHWGIRLFDAADAYLSIMRDLPHRNAPGYETAHRAYAAAYAAAQEQRELLKAVGAELRTRLRYAEVPGA